MTLPRAPVPLEALANLRRHLAALPPRHPERRALMASTYSLYAISRATLYRLLREGRRLRGAHRADRGRPRSMPAAEIERWCELIAALKARTTNKKGRCLSTARALELLVEHGVETPDGLERLLPGRITASTLNRHLRRLGYDHARMARQPPAVRFEAERSNDLWHFDLSPSDLKQLPAPAWIDAERGGAPTLMLFSVVDDRSGLAYLEYRCVHGEDVEAALRFLFAAMSPKTDGANPLQGIPTRLHLDNGPVAKSGVFKRVMESLGVEVLPHMPAGSDGRRTTARAKGKVERPFRTVKEAHETLYHFHQPETEAEANRWLQRFVDTYNARDHRREPHSRADDWLSNLPGEGVRAMCRWERFCTFAREPERRAVGIDCRLTVAGVAYEVDPELTGETIVVWWGLFDQELYVEHGDDRYGPYDPIGGPVPLHRYRKHRKSRREARVERVDALAAQITLPRAALSGGSDFAPAGSRDPPPVRPFVDPDPFRTLTFPTVIAARLAIADALRIPLAKLAAEDLAFINELVQAKKPVVLFVDDAHDLHGNTLKALKRLTELVQDGGGQLSVVLVGHPRLKNDLRRPTMEEIGDRATVLEFGGLRDRQRAYLDWALAAALREDVEPEAVIGEDARVLLAARLKTPLQIGRHLVRTFEAGFEAGVKPVDQGIVDAVLSRRLEDLEPQLTRHGYDVRSLCEQFDARPAEIRRLLRGDLEPARTNELTDQMRAAGLPV